MIAVVVALTLWHHRQLFHLSLFDAAENIISTMPDALIIADTQGKIRRVNDRFLEFFGSSEEDVSGKQLSESFSDKKTCEDAIAQLKETGTIKNLEVTLKTRSGEQRVASVSGSVVRRSGGRCLGYTFIFHDVTGSKQIEAKLAAAERFASLGQFAGMVGHDLRNPLSTMNTATYYLKNHYSAKMDAAGNQMLETIERSIDYSSKMITDLLDYSGEIRLEREVTTLKLVLNRAFTYLNVPPNIKVVDESRGCPQVLLDEAKICRVLVNLVKNAFDAMPNGGTLTVATKKTGGNVELTLRDTGVGMAPETLNRLWTPLFTTKTKGLGFGLTICKRIMEAHGGQIHVESQLGEGTAFTLSFPLKSQ